MEQSEELSMAVRHVRQGRIVVARQRQYVEDLQASSRPSQWAETLLATFLASQDIFERHERQLREKLEAAEARGRTG